ncbi:O-antigen ligase family protein [Enterococcus thailandicus]|uniref:O-antigen ligase family protein n=1 Tax=Enterococcus TaxID=1350 RepID=UPI0022E4902A|nr:O-antigen ligase family protein [Enterococcus thailandicus]
MDSHANKKIFYKELYILILYSVTLLRSIGAWSLIPSSIDSMLFNVVGLVGGLILLVEFFEIITKKKNFDYDISLVLFLTAFFISILLNHQYAFFANIKNFSWEALFLLTIFSLAKNSEVKKSFFVKFQVILVGFGFIMSFISLLMFIFNFSYITPLANKTNPLRLGFVENRLFGAYSDPNYAAVMATIVILFSVYLFLKVSKSMLMRSLIIINIIIQILYIGLSGSRNGLIVLLALTSVYVFFQLFYSKDYAKHSILKNTLYGVVAAAVVSSAMFLLVDVSKNGISQLPELTQEISFKQKNTEIKNKDEVNLSRKDVARSGDISNMRFTLWKSGFEIFKTRPFFGVAPKSIHDYAKNELPDTYLAKTNLAVHNAYLNVLVCTGIAGAITAGFFLLKNMIRILRYAFKNNIKQTEFLYYMLAVLALALSGLFHNEIFFMTTSSPLVFWVFLGGVNNIMNNKEK